MKRLACLALCLLAGCQPRYETLEFELLTSPPVPVRVSGAEIELPVGLAVAVRVAPQSGNGPQYTDDDLVVLRSRDRAVALSEPAGADREFVLVGVAEGETCIAVEINHDEADCIPTRVVAGE